MAHTPRRTVGTDHQVGPDTLANALEALTGLSRNDLVKRWVQAHGRPPPKGMSRRLIERAVAYQAQVEAFGGMRTELVRKLKRHLDHHDCSKTPTLPGPKRLATGTQLIREWNGRTHVVEVTATEMIWNGQSYRSLSAVAKAITGVKWSGPRFFGL